MPKEEQAHAADVLSHIHKLDTLTKGAIDLMEGVKTKPRNPRHFDGLEGGRKRVSDTFTHKNSGSCI